MPTSISKPSQLGRLVTASNDYYECLVPASQFSIPAFGDLVIAEISPDYRVFGLIGSISVHPIDGVEQYAIAAENLQEDTLTDLQNTPAKLGVIVVGFVDKGKISQMVPPRPPISLAGVSIANPQELVAFTENRGYLRHVLKVKSSTGLPAIEILAAHICRASEAHQAAGNKNWTVDAVTELTSQLRDDYDSLLNFAQAISDIPAAYFMKGG